MGGKYLWKNIVCKTPMAGEGGESHPLSRSSKGGRSAGSLVQEKEYIRRTFDDIFDKCLVGEDFKNVFVRTRIHGISRSVLAQTSVEGWWWRGY